MRAFSRILGTIALFFIAFFFIGVFIPSVSYDIEIKVDRPSAEAFNALTDSDLLPTWVDGLQSSELVKGEPGKPGSVYSMTIVKDGRTNIFKETITQANPDSLLTYSVESQGVSAEVEIKLEKRGETTVVKVSTIMTGNVWFTRSFLPLFKESLTGRILEDYRTFKSVLESK